MPRTFLHVLAPIRNQSEIRVVVDNETAWVRWPAGRSEIVHSLLPVPGVVFYAQRDARWYRFGCRLPAAERPPRSDGEQLPALLTPGHFEPISPPQTIDLKLLLRVIHGGEPQPATALVCGVSALSSWGDSATTAELAAVRAVRCGERAVLLGAHLPAIPAAVRYWGTDLLVPIGFRAEPDLPPGALRMALGAADDELALLDESGAELIPRSAFAPLTRPGIRLAIGQYNSEGRPS
jgi:hypothetical protein